MAANGVCRIRKIARFGVVMLLAVAVIGCASFAFPKAYAGSRPGKVTLTSAKSASYNSIRLTWKKAVRAKKYQVYCAPSKSGKYKLVGTTAKLNFTHKKLKLGRKYYYKVRALNGKLAGPFSSVKGATPVLGKPDVWMEEYGVACLIPCWDPVDGAQYYEVQRESTDPDSDYELIGTTEAEMFDDYDLDMQEDSPIFYYYRVRSVRRAGGKTYKSSWSNEVMSSLAPEDKSLTDGIDIKLIERGSGNIIAVVRNNNSVTTDVYLKMRFFEDDKDHAATISEDPLIDLPPGKTAYARFRPEDVDGERVNYKSYKLYTSAKEAEAYTDYSDKLDVALDGYSSGQVKLTVINNSGVAISADAGFIFFDKNGKVLDFNSDTLLMNIGESQSVLLDTIDLGGEDYDLIEPVVFRAGKY